MQVLIYRNESIESGKYFEADCGKTSAYVYASKLGYIRVCCKNAMHKAWKGNGRVFQSFNEALAGYKSAEMKAIITASMEA